MLQGISLPIALRPFYEAGLPLLPKKRLNPDLAVYFHIDERLAIFAGVADSDPEAFVGIRVFTPDGQERDFADAASTLAYVKRLGRPALSVVHSQDRVIAPLGQPVASKASLSVVQGGAS